MSPSDGGMRLHLVHASELPQGTTWLSEEERAVLGRLVVEKRRGDWLLGRLAAKRAVGEALGLEPCERIAVLATAGGAPAAYLDGAPVPLTLSLSHSGGRAVAVVAPAAVQLGCDLERVERREPSFAETFLTAAERAAAAQLLGEAQDEQVTLCWSAKECALKAMRDGLRRDTREVEVVLGPVERWRAVRAVHQDGAVFTGWATRLEGDVLVVLSAPALPVPEIRTSSQR